MDAREFIMTPVFDKRWHDLGLTDEDLRTLQNALIKNPYAGDVIENTGGARKVRFAFPNQGKRGSVRVIYTNITHLEIILLILCYSKGEQDDLTPEQKKQIKAVIRAMEGDKING